jgi:hypothetical protein
MSESHAPVMPLRAAADRTRWLRAHPSATLHDALALFDASAPVNTDDMRGRWRGSGLPTGHLMDGLLEHYGWFGKHFHDADHVDPLLFMPFVGHGAPFAVSPRLMPLGLARFRGLAHSAFARTVFGLALPLLRTRRAAARLRHIEYRGVVTATMIYDHLPIHDVFRRVDDDTLIGLMDQRGAPQPFFFLLRRDTTG